MNTDRKAIYVRGRGSAYKPQILAVVSEGKLLFLKLDTDYRIILKCIVRK